MSPSDTTERGLERLRAFLEGRKKWFALHGTNSILRFLEPGADGSLRVDCPEDNLPFMQMLGSQFMAHAPIHEYPVHVT